MTIIFNAKVSLSDNSGNVQVFVKGNAGWLLPDLDKVCSISIRLGVFYGYDFADFLQTHLSDGFPGNEWEFGVDDASAFLQSAHEILEGETVEYEEDIRDFIKVLEEAMDTGYHQFELCLW